MKKKDKIRFWIINDFTGDKIGEASTLKEARDIEDSKYKDDWKEGHMYYVGMYRIFDVEKKVLLPIE
jgi:hypothetical protein